MAQCQLDVARTRRHIHDEVIQIRPCGLVEQLLQGLRDHRATPRDRVVIVNQKTNRIDLHAVLRVWHHQFLRVEFRFSCQVEQSWHRRAINIRIQYPDTRTFVRQRERDVDCGGAFAHAAFARSNRDDVFDIRRNAHARLCDVRMNLGLNVDVQWHVGDRLHPCAQIIMRAGARQRQNHVDDVALDAFNRTQLSQSRRRAVQNGDGVQLCE